MFPVAELSAGIQRWSSLRPSSEQQSAPSDPKSDADSDSIENESEYVLAYDLEQFQPTDFGILGCLHHSLLELLFTHLLQPRTVLTVSETCRYGHALAVRAPSWLISTARSKLALWLDAADLNEICLSGSDAIAVDADDHDGIADVSVTHWRSKVAGRGMRQMPQCGGPRLLRFPGGGQAVKFDYDRSLKLTRYYDRVHTLISVHRFEPPVPGQSDCQFYVLSGEQQGPFHGGKEEVINGHGGWVSPHAQNGTIRLSGMEARPAVDYRISDWNVFNVSVFECEDVLHQGTMSQGHDFRRTVNRIGRDRNCHAFNGSIAELLIFSEPLTLQEIEHIEQYLTHKWTKLGLLI